jgi:hypothetical protein
MTQEKLLREKKEYLNYLKIASFRKGFSNTEKGKKSKSGFSFHVFEKEDGVVFSCRSRSTSGSPSVSFFQDFFKFKLRVFKTKNGETRFRFYNIMQRIGAPVARTCSPVLMQSKLRQIVIDAERGKRKPKYNENAFKGGLYIAQQKRLISFLRKFLARHGVSTRGYSKNPLVLLTQLCYPGTKAFSDETISERLSCGQFFLDDPVKLALRSNGKRSRKLVYQAIAASPYAAQSILRMAKHIRITRSLDHAQRFLSRISANTNLCPHDDTNHAINISRLPAKHLRMLDAFSEDALYEAFIDEISFFIDSMLMMRDMNAENGFGLGDIRPRTIHELHDTLIDVSPNRKRKKRFNDYSFSEDLVSIKFCKTLAANFGDGIHSIEYAKDTSQLRKQAEKMHNCAFGYHSAISNGGYAVFCVKKYDSLFYMFGVRLYSKHATLDQAVSHCNGSIDPVVLKELNVKIAAAVKGEYEYNFDPRGLIE